MEKCCFCENVFSKDELTIFIDDDDVFNVVCLSCYERESDTVEIY